MAASKISVVKSHNLPVSEARLRLDIALCRFQDLYGLTLTWPTDTKGVLTRPGAKGSIEITGGEVRAELALSYAMSPLRALRERIQRRLGEALLTLDNDAKSEASTVCDALGHRVNPRFLDGLAIGAVHVSDTPCLHCGQIQRVCFKVQALKPGELPPGML